MAILGRVRDKVEVRIAKSRFDAANPVYFDAYEKLGNPFPSTVECTRYIVPQDGEHVIHITLKAGFHYGEYDGIIVRLHDKITKKEIGQPVFEKDAEIEYLDSNEYLLVESLNHVIVDGEKRNNVKLTFQNLIRGTDHGFRGRGDIGDGSC